MAKKNGSTQGKGDVDISPDMLKEMYKDMLFYRRFEETVHRAYTKGKFAGFCHLHIGQEAVCVGVQKAIRKSDYMISGYRERHSCGESHGRALR